MTLAPRRTVEIVPSLLAADLSRLGETLALAAAAGVRWVSVDVMDGHFVPNLSFGPDFVRLVKKRGNFLVDAHLMVDNPEIVVPWFAKAGADIVTVHWEACRDPRAAIAQIKKLGAKAGLAVKPQSPVEGLIELLPELDLALVMTVEPGFGGAAFIESQLSKVARVRAAIDDRRLPCWLQVDGGVNLQTVEKASSAGADSLVAGTAVFGAPDIGAAFRELKELAEKSFCKGLRPS